MKKNQNKNTIPQLQLYNMNQKIASDMLSYLVRKPISVMITLISTNELAALKKYYKLLNEEEFKKALQSAVLKQEVIASIGKSEYIPMLKQLEEWGVDFKNVSYQGSTLLSNASILTDFIAVKTIYEKEWADISEKSVFAALYFTVYNYYNKNTKTEKENNIKIVKFLLSKIPKIDLNTTEFHGKTILYPAALKDFPLHHLNRDNNKLDTNKKLKIDQIEISFDTLKSVGKKGDYKKNPVTSIVIQQDQLGKEKSKALIYKAVILNNEKSKNYLSESIAIGENYLEDKVQLGLFVRLYGLVNTEKNISAIKYLELLITTNAKNLKQEDQEDILVSLLCKKGVVYANRLDMVNAIKTFKIAYSKACSEEYHIQALKELGKSICEFHPKESERLLNLYIENLKKTGQNQEYIPTKKNTQTYTPTANPEIINNNINQKSSDKIKVPKIKKTIDSANIIAREIIDEISDLQNDDNYSDNILKIVEENLQLYPFLADAQSVRLQYYFSTTYYYNSNNMDKATKALHTVIDSFNEIDKEEYLSLDEGCISDLFYHMLKLHFFSNFYKNFAKEDMSSIINIFEKLKKFDLPEEIKGFETIAYKAVDYFKNKFTELLNPKHLTYDEIDLLVKSEIFENIDPKSLHQYFQTKEKKSIDNLKFPEKQETLIEFRWEFQDHKEKYKYCYQGQNNDCEVIKIQYLDNYYAVIKQNVKDNIEEIHFKMCQNALQNKVKILKNDEEHSIIELCIKDDLRLTTHNIFKNIDGKFLIVFDKVSDHKGVKRDLQQKLSINYIDLQIERFDNKSVNNENYPNEFYYNKLDKDDQVDLSGDDHNN